MNEVEIREHLGNYKSLLEAMAPQARRHADETNYVGLGRLAKLFSDAAELVNEITVALPEDLPSEKKVGGTGTFTGEPTDIENHTHTFPPHEEPQESVDPEKTE